MDPTLVKGLIILAGAYALWTGMRTMDLYDLSDNAALLYSSIDYGKARALADGDIAKYYFYYGFDSGGSRTSVLADERIGMPKYAEQTPYRDITLPLQDASGYYA